MYPSIPPEPYPHGYGSAVAPPVSVREAVDYFRQIKDLDNLVRAVTRFVDAPANRAGLVEFLRTGPYLPPQLAAVFTRLGLTGDTPSDARHPTQTGETEPLLLLAAGGPPRDPGAFGRLGDYKLLDLIGRGGMGTVYEAEDVRLRRKVAVKTLLPELAANPNARERFLREAEAAAKVESDFIVPIFQVGDEGGTPFLVMPLLKGEPLDKYLVRHPHGLPVAEAVRIARDVAAGLSAAHGHDLIHRDIKPANIWLEGSTRRVRVLDFGVVRHRDLASDLTRTGAVLGTPGYMAPEQAGGGEVDHRADLFSLGCVLYELLTGRKAFLGATPVAILAAAATADPPAARAVDPRVPADVSGFVQRLMARNKHDRPRSTDAVHARLAELCDKLTADPWAKPRPRGNWVRVAAAVAVGLTGLGVLGVGLYAHQTGWLARPSGVPPPGPAPVAPVTPVAETPEPSEEQAAALRAALTAARPSLGPCVYVVRGRATVRAAAGDAIPEDVTDVHRYVVARSGGRNVLEPLRHTTALKELVFADYLLEDAEFAACAGLPGAGTVERIEFGPRCRTGRRAVVALRSMPLLKAVAFDGPYYADGDAWDQLANVPALAELRLTNTNVSNDVLRAVARIPRLKQLTLNGNARLTSAGLTHLSGAAALEAVTLDTGATGGPPVTAVFTPIDAHGLKAICPRVRVKWQGKDF